MKYKLRLFLLLTPILLCFSGVKSGCELDLSVFKSEKKVKIILCRMNIDPAKGPFTKLDSLDVTPKKLVKWRGKTNQPFVGFFLFYNGSRHLGTTPEFVFSNDGLTVSSKVSEDGKKSFQVLGGENELYHDENFLKEPADLKLYARYYKRRNFYSLADLNENLTTYETNILDLVKKYPGKYTTAYKLDGLSLFLRTSVLEDCYNQLDENIKTTDAGKSIKTTLLNSKVMVQGKKIPEFEVFTVAGEKKLFNSTLKDQFYFIDIWASWCAPCRANFKYLKELYSRADTSKIQFLSISIDRHKKDWIIARNQEVLPWTDYLQSSGQVSEIFGIKYIPQSVIIDGKGNMVERNLTKQTLNEFLIKHKLLRND
jgi:thiol-disulfide isomerase/thioredoxin